MSQQKAKGDRFERDVVRVLKANGHPYAERALRLGAHKDHADVAGVPGFHIECRDRGRIELGAWMHMAALEAARIPSRPTPVLVIKRRMQATERSYVVLQLEDFANLIADKVTA